MRVEVSTRLSSKGRPFDQKLRLLKRILDADPKAVKVGLPAGKVGRDLVQIGVWNHFGTRGGASGGGWGGPVPPRPFITITFFEQRRNIRSDLRKIARRALVYSEPLAPQMSKMGIKYSGAVQGRIAAFIAPANSPVTIKLKGSAVPLIDSGRMRQSITWDLT
jgi:hypothetical protein